VAQGTGDVHLQGVGHGTYAFGIDGWFDGGSHERQTLFATRFSLSGGPLELTSTDDVADVRVEGGTVRARWTRYEEYEGAARVRFDLSRVPDATDPPRVIAEQAVLSEFAGGPSYPFRDALALARKYDADRVELTGETNIIPPTGYDGPTPFAFRGDAYRVHVERADG
jgi:hypothetical protein